MSSLRRTCYLPFTSVSPCPLRQESVPQGNLVVNEKKRLVFERIGPSLVGFELEKLNQEYLCVWEEISILLSLNNSWLCRKDSPY